MMMKKQLSKDITGLIELQDEIRLVKSRIRNHEQDIEKRWERLPEETFKATLGLVIPAFINNRIAGGTFGILKQVAALFIGSKIGGQQSNWKDLITGSAKKIGLVAGLKFLYSLVSKRSKL